MEDKLKSQMRRAMSQIADVLSDNSDEHEISQETNIFKILKMENYEIRHANFLEYLMDPERNPELAKIFMGMFIDEIVYDQGIDDNAFDRILDYEDPEEFEILRIEGANRYTEIPAGKDETQRIDHALEVKVGQARRVLVFEYKHNGTVQNDLNSYVTTVDKKYEKTKAKVYYFMLDLGSKSLKKSYDSKFVIISKNLVINAVRRTLDVAKNKDMQATRMYLEQYLDIISGTAEADKIYTGYEDLFWKIWNPEIERSDPEADYYNALVDEYFEDDDVKSDMYDFNYEQIFTNKIHELLKSYPNLLYSKEFQSWARIYPLKCKYKNLYFEASVYVEDFRIFYVVRLSSYQDLRVEKELVQEQTNFIKLILKQSQFSDLISTIEDIDTCQGFRICRDVNGELSLYDKNQYKANSKRIDGLYFHYMNEVELSTIEQDISTYDASDDFQHLIDVIEEFSGLINAG